MTVSYLNHYQDHLQRIAEYEDIVARLTALGFTLNAIDTTISNAFQAVGVQANRYLAPYIPTDGNDTTWAIDLIYLLGAKSWNSWENPYPSQINITVPNDLSLSPQPANTAKSNILSPNWQGEFFLENSQLNNANIVFDFGTKRIRLDGIAWQLHSVASYRPTQVAIWGYNDNQPIQHLMSEFNMPSNLSGGQWLKFSTNQSYPDFYRYLRISSPAPSSGTYKISAQQIKFYGELILG